MTRSVMLRVASASRAQANTQVQQQQQRRNFRSPQTLLSLQSQQHQRRLLVISKQQKRWHWPSSTPAATTSTSAITVTKSSSYSSSSKSATAIAVPLAVAAAGAASLPSVSSASLFRQAWQAYCRSLEKQPLITKASMAAFIFFSSDSATQYVSTNGDGSNFLQQDYQGTRAMSAAAFGMVATTWMHFWWGFLERVVGARLPQTTHRLSNTLAKVVTDQSIGAPLYIYTYFVLTNFLQDYRQYETMQQARDAWKRVNAKAQDRFWPTMKQHWKLWPCVHTLNFYYIPLHHRVLVQNTVLVGWSGYLSHLNHATSTTTSVVEEKEGNKVQEQRQRQKRDFLINAQRLLARSDSVVKDYQMQLD